VTVKTEREHVFFKWIFKLTSGIPLVSPGHL
jgi:hypothetical protein